MHFSCGEFSTENLLCIIEFSQFRAKLKKIIKEKNMDLSKYFSAKSSKLDKVVLPMNELPRSVIVDNTNNSPKAIYAALVEKFVLPGNT